MSPVYSQSPATTRPCLITGGGGQLAVALRRAFEARELPCVACPREAVDIRDTASLEHRLDCDKPSFVLHTAAIEDVRTCESNAHECWQTNAEAASRVFVACARRGIPVVLFSTAAVFSGLAPIGFRGYEEWHPPSPCNVHARTKLSAETSLANMSPRYWANGFRHWILRTSEVYSSFPETPHHRNLANYISSQARLPKALGLPGDVLRNPTYAPHLADAVVWLVSHASRVPCGLYHLASPDACSMYDFGREILRTTREVRAELFVSTAEAYARVENIPIETLPRNLTLRCDKWTQAGGMPLPSWRVGAREYLKARGGVIEA